MCSLIANHYSLEAQIVHIVMEKSFPEWESGAGNHGGLLAHFVVHGKAYRNL